MTDARHNSPTSLDRYTRVGELGDAFHGMLRKAIPAISLMVAILVARMLVINEEGWLGLLWMGVGTVFALSIWRTAGIGLPLLPIFAIQHLAVYGIPLVNRNETIAGYSSALVDNAGLEVLIMLAACALVWRLCMTFFSPAGAKSLALRIFAVEGNRALNRIGIGLITLSAGYELLNALRLTGAVMSMLPGGAHSIVVAVINAAGMSGYFLTAMAISSGGAHRPTRTFFWCTLTGHLILLTSSILLSSVINIVGAAVIGLFWGAGRIPRTFLLVCSCLLAFLNLGKFEMRERHWGASGQMVSELNVSTLPGFYMEWVGYSLAKISGDNPNEEKTRKNQTMLARMDNLQNLLFVSDRVVNTKSPVLGGETYALIPPLLIPRILWPEKPRTHEGQVILNTHFGRQSREDSFTTYIAWGLLPEAYGNFGPIWGAVILGGVLGIVFAGLENFTANKPLLSLEGMVTFVLLIGIAASFEMVASVLITSLFQAVLTVIMACAPFVQSMTLTRDDEEESSA